MKTISLGEQEKQYDEAKQKIDDAISHTSRSFLGLCKNTHCYQSRRHNSAFCADCAARHKANQYLNNL